MAQTAQTKIISRIIISRGGSRIFIWGGGGVKDYVPARTLRAQNIEFTVVCKSMAQNQTAGPV